MFLHFTALLYYLHALLLLIFLLFATPGGPGVKTHASAAWGCKSKPWLELYVCLYVCDACITIIIENHKHKKELSQ